MRDEWLRGLTDAELDAVVGELEDREEFFDLKVRSQVNDELRRRKRPVVRLRRW